MKNTKTTLTELTKQYRAVLMKCLYLNTGLILILSTAARAEYNVDLSDYYNSETNTYTIDGDDIITSNDAVLSLENTTLNIKDSEIIGGHKTVYTINSPISFFKDDNSLKSLTDEDIVVLETNYGKTIGEILEEDNNKHRFEIQLDSDGKLVQLLSREGAEISFNNVVLNLDTAGIETNKNITFTNGTTLRSTCIGCYGWDEEDQKWDNEYIIMGDDVTVNDSNIILGDASDPRDNYSYIGANRDLTIKNESSITLNSYSTLAYEGTLSENGPGSVQISNSTLTLNDNSNLKIGMNEDDDGNQVQASAFLTISDLTTINLNDNAKIEFALTNKENTIIDNSTINMSGNSSMSLNDMTLNNESKINMKEYSSVVADNVVLNDSYINMKDNSVLDVYNVTFNGGEINSLDNSKVYIKALKDDYENKLHNTLTLNGTDILTAILSDFKENLIRFFETIHFSGLFDPATAEVNGVLTRSGYDDEITYNINENGILKYTDDKYLYDSTMHTHPVNRERLEDNTFSDKKYALNTINFKGGILDLRNGTATAIHLASLTLKNGTTSSIYADVDLANQRIDTLSADTITVEEGAKLNIVGLNLVSDATKEKTSITFTDNDDLKAATSYTGETTGLKALSPLYTYDVAYEKGVFEFTRSGSGESVTDYNPAVYSSTTVSQSVGLLSSNINSIAFAGLSGENSSPQGQSGGDMPNVGNAWVKVVGFDENVDFDSFQTIDSQVFSVIGGMTTDKVKLGNSDINFGAYMGYLNGEQKYTGNKVNQNGGYVGLSTSWTKDRIVLDGTINAGFIRNEAKNSFGTDKYNTYWTGAALKAGYNYNISHSLTLTPSFYAGYTLVDIKDYTSQSGVHIKNDKTHVFEFTPGIKLTQQFNQNWKGFIQGKYAILKNHGGDVTADDIALPNISTDNYAEYGVGLDKVLTDNWTLSLTANRRDGGRQGWNGSVEVKYNF